MVQCSEELKVSQAAYYLTEDADYWWENSRAGLMRDCDEALGWEDFKRVLREKFYPIHVRKDKSNEFARFEMGNLIVDEYYQ